MLAAKLAGPEVYPVLSPTSIMSEAVLYVVVPALGYVLYSSERRHREHRLDPWSTRLLLIRLELAMGGILLFAIGAFVFCLSLFALCSWYLMGFCFGILVFMIACFGLAKGYGIVQLARSRFGVLRTDPRKATVMLLRSFRDDRITVAEDRGFRQSGKPPGSSIPVRVALDSLLAQIASKAGRCVSVGDPSENLPHAGLGRVYYTDEEWKDHVKTLVGKVGRILIVPSDSDGLNWELEYIRESGLLGKVVLVFPPEAASAKQQRWRLFRERMVREGWDLYDEQITAESLAVFFPGGSKPMIIQSPGTSSAKAYVGGARKNPVGGAIRP